MPNTFSDIKFYLIQFGALSGVLEPESLKRLENLGKHEYRGTRVLPRGDVEKNHRGKKGKRGRF